MQIKYKESENSTTQALTEVALALSMAFFALLVLALISMGSASKTNAKNIAEIDKIKISSTKASQQAKQQQYLIYFQRQFYDIKLNKIKPAQVNSDFKSADLVLALSQNLSFSEVLEVKQQINHPNLSITTLTANWVKRLEQLP